MNKKRINIAMSFNSSYLKYAYVLLTSLFENKRPETEFHIYILQRDLTVEDKSYLEALAQCHGAVLQYLIVDDSLFPSSLPTRARWSLETYFRLMLSDLLTEEVDRLLYVDADTIFVQDVSELYFTDFEDAVLCACPDVFPPKEKKAFKAMVENEGYTYFNAGVLLFNMELYREKYHFADYMKAAEALQYKLFAPDQDLLNYLHFREVKILDNRRFNLPAWSVPGLNMSTAQVKDEVVLLHFIGEGKPWNAKNPHYEVEKLWWDYVKKTPFYHELLEEFMCESMLDLSIRNSVSTLLKANELHRKNNEILLKDNELLQKDNGLLRKEIENCAALLQQVSKFIK